MNTKAAPSEIASTILNRSTCSVMVGAAIEDYKGRVISWGWNSVGGGFGQHAEHHAIERANKDRLDGATIYVATIRRRNRKVINSKPCADCQYLIDFWELAVVYRNAEGEWVEI